MHKFQANATVKHEGLTNQVQLRNKKRGQHTKCNCELLNS